MIPHRNISLLSNRLAKAGGQRFREDVLERDYCLAWFLTAVGGSDLKSVLAFKGGTALKRCYFSEYRFSEDLDFTLIEAISLRELLRRLESVYAVVRERSGTVLSFDRTTPRNTRTATPFISINLNYVGPLPSGNDVTLREHVVYPLKQRPVLRGYEEFTDLPNNEPVAVYSLDEIAAEKTMALADRARNEPRDLYDLWYLTSNAGIELASLKGAIAKRWRFAEIHSLAWLKPFIRRKPA